MKAKVQDSVLYVEFRDHPTRNSFSLRAAEELKVILEKNVASCSAVIFSAPGARVFCSGGNLADYAAMTTAEAGREVNQRIGDVLEMISKIEIPTVCLIHGDCFGGGLELMSAFDLVLASPFALFGFWQRKVGLTFGWGGGARLESRVGEMKLQQLALSAATIGAIEAERLGLIDAVCLEALMVEQALSRVRALSKLPKAPVALIKAATLENERANFNSLWWNNEHREVLARKIGRVGSDR